MSARGLFQAIYYNGFLDKLSLSFVRVCLCLSLIKEDHKKLVLLQLKVILMGLSI